MSQPETELRRAIVKAVNASGYAWLGIVNQDYRGKQRRLDAMGIGCADLVGLTRGGRFCALEVKTKTGKERPGQLDWAETVTRLHGFVRTVRTVDEAIEAARLADQGSGLGATIGHTLPLFHQGNHPCLSG